VDALGYILKPDENYNLVREFKNQSDGKKADGAILKDGKAIAVIELKSTKTKDLKSITQQAFNYKNNQPECKYVITSNFQKLRFYIDYASYQPPTYDPLRVPPSGGKKPIGFEDIMAIGSPNIKLLFELALRGVLNIECLIFVEPHWMNRRMDMQQGAFLVPLKLKKGFLGNLMAVLSSNEKETDEVKISDIKDNSKAIQTI